MIRKVLFILLVLIFPLSVLISCSNNIQAGTTPILPDQTQACESRDTISHNLRGLFNIEIDPVTLEYEIAPARLGATHWNVLKWLETGPCTDCVKIEGITPTPDGTLDVDVTIVHPFPGMNLTGFDVRGIAMFDGSHNFPSLGLSMPDASLGDGELVNADGYTSLYNSLTVGEGPGGLQGYIDGKFSTDEIPDANINGYKRHVSIDPLNTRNAFYSGHSITETYEIDFPDPPSPWVFGYAVDASWVPPDVLPVEDPMTDFPPEANCPEAWRIEILSEAIGQGLTDEGGQAQLMIRIYDYQGTSTIENVQVECPDLFSGTVEATYYDTYPDYFEYMGFVENTLLASTGEYRCLVMVEDSENSDSPWWLELKSYQQITLTVAEFIPQAEAPVAIAYADPTEQFVGAPVNFYDDGSYDPDGGDIVLYEWDWDNDGTFDDTGANAQHSFDTEGTHHVQFRVTDDEDATDTLDQPLEILVMGGQLPPIAMAGADPVPQTVCEDIHFYDDGSIDEDGPPVKFEWDWDNDGTWDEEAEDTYHSWDVPGTYYVQFRVTDIDGLTDELDSPLEIIVENALPTASAHPDDSTPEIGQDVTFDGSASSDNDCGDESIVLYEWDWDNDGSWDDSNTTPISIHSFDTASDYEVQLRVTDDEGETDTLDFPLLITVLEWDPCLDLDEVIKGSHGWAYTQTMQVIKDQSTWSSWYTTATGGGTAPFVDFGEEMVIAVTMGEFPTGGYYPTIDWACFDDAMELEIMVGWHHPGPDCMVIQVFTQPYIAVVTDRHDEPYYFTTYLDVYPCD